MSGETWLKEFFFQQPEEVVNNFNLMLNHAKIKWNGLKKENLLKHNVCLKKNSLYDGESCFLVINHNSCAFCLSFFENECKGCPIFDKLGEKCNEQRDSPYSVFLLTSNVEPMLKTLEEIASHSDVSVV